MATTDAPPHLLTVPQVADELGLSKRTVRRRIADGEIPAVKLGRGPNAPVRVDRGELSEWLAAHQYRRDTGGPQPLLGKERAP